MPSYRPPVDVARAARRGLDIRARQTPSNRAGTAVGIARAGQLANRRPVSVETLRRMVSFFARHDANKDVRQRDKSSKANQAWLLWGGTPGRRWAVSVLAGLDDA